MKFFQKKIFWLLIAAIGVRLLYGLNYPPRSVPDTEGYYRTGEQLVSGDYSDYTGKRPPVYPLITAAAGFNLTVIVWFQAALGVALALILFRMFSILTGSETVGLILALSQALNPSQILFEFCGSSETACTFFLVLTVFLLIGFLHRPEIPGGGHFLVSGFFSSLVVLTRGQFLPLPFLILLFLIWRYRSKSRELIRNLTYFLVPVAVLLGSWSAFQYARIGKFAISPDLGISLTSHTIPYIESAPERFRDLKQVLIDHREYNLRTKGTIFNAVAASLPDLLRLTGGNYIALCDKMKEMNIITITRNPVRYLKSVIISFVTFFKPTWMGRLFGIRPAVARGGWAERIIAASFAAFHLTCMAVFIFVPLLQLLTGRLKAVFKWTPSMLFIFALVFMTAASQALVERGENSRYKTSVEPLMICVAVWIMLNFAAEFFPGKKRPAV